MIEKKWTPPVGGARWGMDSIGRPALAGQDGNEGYGQSVGGGEILGFPPTRLLLAPLALRPVLVLIAIDETPALELDEDSKGRWFINAGASGDLGSCEQNAAVPEDVLNPPAGVL